jgi:NitT/TauT family transport system substrate-binding protein/sulfonate transport system substrate-binding protein
MRNNRWSVKTFVSLFVALIFLSALVPSDAGAVDKLRLSLQPTPDCFVVWRIINEGLDKKAGLDLEMIYADSGVSQIEALPAKVWDLANLGGVPMLMGALRYKAYMIALSANDGYNNMVMVRPDSPVLKAKGTNPKYPDLYGSAETVKGKTVLVPTVTSAHYALSGTIKALGLMDKDVVLQNMEPGQAVAAFDSGVGDMISVWVPFSLTGIKKGWKVVADGAMTGSSVPLVWTTPREFGDKNPELVKKFMLLYFQQIDRYQSELKNDRAALVPKVRKVFKDWGGMDMTEEMVSMMLDTYKMYDLKQNLQMLDDSKGKSEAFMTMRNVADFFTENKRFTPEQREQVLNTDFITPKFLK